MVLRNRDGRTVDAVPFVVSCGAAFLLLYSFIPLYLHAFGLSLAEALGATTGIYAVAIATAYDRQVLRADPSHREEVPARLRFRWLYYLMLVTVGVVLLLSLPLVFR